MCVCVCVCVSMHVCVCVSMHESPGVMCVGVCGCVWVLEITISVGVLGNINLKDLSMSVHSGSY